MVPKAAVADEAPAPALTSQWVVFLCKDTRFGMQLDRIREIVPPRPFTRMPGSGAEVCGLIGVRGRVVTVLDLGVLLTGASSAAAEDHRLLLLDLDGRTVAAAVDEVISIARSAMDGQAAPAWSGPGCMGTGHVDGSAFVALDPAELLGPLLQ
jgi:purine-binding chemotaxis protein CheW